MANIVTKMTDGGGLGLKKKKPTFPDYQNPSTQTPKPIFSGNYTIPAPAGTPKQYNPTQIIMPAPQQQIIAQPQQQGESIQEMMEALCVKPSKAQLRAMERFYNNR